MRLVDYIIVYGNVRDIGRSVMRWAEEGYELIGGPFANSVGDTCQAMVKYEPSPAGISLSKMRH